MSTKNYQREVLLECLERNALIKYVYGIPSMKVRVDEKDLNEIVPLILRELSEFKVAFYLILTALLEGKDHKSAESFKIMEEINWDFKLECAKLEMFGVDINEIYMTSKNHVKKEED
jgi:hypothetical protein